MSTAAQQSTVIQQTSVRHSIETCRRWSVSTPRLAAIPQSDEGCEEVQSARIRALWDARGERNALEQLRRYITYPALSHEKVQPNAAGRVVLKLKTPW
jgi:hypothetical protein